MSARAKDRIGSLILLGFVAALFLQRDYMTRFGGMFPDLVMAVLAALLVLTLVLSFTSHPAIREPVAEKPEGPKARWKDLLVVGIVLLAWGLLLRPIGFAVTGVLSFTALSLYLAEGPRGAGTLARSVAVAAGVTGILMLVFGKILQVPLPPGAIFP